MNAVSSEVIDLIRRACGGDSAALRELLDAYRPYLKILARRQLDAKIEARLSAFSDPLDMGLHLGQQQSVRFYLRIAASNVGARDNPFDLPTAS